MSKKHKRVFTTLNLRLEHLLNLVSTVTGCVSISAFVYLVGISIGIVNSAIELIICAITAGIKQYKWVIKKKKRNHVKIVLLSKTKSTIIAVLISRALIGSYISHEEFTSIDNVLRKYNDMKEKVKNLKSSTIY